MSAAVQRGYVVMRRPHKGEVRVPVLRLSRRRRLAQMVRRMRAARWGWPAIARACRIPRHRVEALAATGPCAGIWSPAERRALASARRVAA